MVHCPKKCSIGLYHNDERRDGNGISMVHMMTRDMEE